MTPTLPDLLTGQSLSLAMPMPPEAAGDYMVGRLGLMAMIAILAAQEAERGVAARVWENAALRALFDKAASRYDPLSIGSLAEAADGVDDDLSWSALDRANATLRRLLIALHEAVELAGDTEKDREIIVLYQAMAHHRRLEIPGPA